jgi:hypothetical protein
MVVNLQSTGDSPGAKARVHFNGPTEHLSAVATGVVTLEPVRVRTHLIAIRKRS